MPISASIRLLAAAALTVPIAAACAPYEPEATSPGTTPPVWTGSPSPSAPAAEGGHGESHGSDAAHAETLTADLKSSDGTDIATATIDFADGFATVTVEATAGELTPGFHGLHIHQVGTCEGDFTSAGGHFQVEGHTGHPFSGDLSSLQVRSDGSAKLVTTTDAFTAEDLLDGTGTSLMIHEGPDNFGNIPPEKYQQINGTPGPDQQTLSTGDAGARVACGVISAE